MTAAARAAAGYFPFSIASRNAWRALLRSAGRPRTRTAGTPCAASRAGARWRTPSVPRTSRSSASWMCRSVSVSTLLVASSRIRIRGSCRIARAIDTRCRSPPRQRLPPLAHDGVVPVGELDDEVVRVGRPRRRDHLVRASRPACRTGCSPARCRGTGTGPGAPSRSAAGSGRLSSCRTSTPSTLHRPAAHVVEPGDQVHDRGLAAARRAHQPDHLARLHLEAHAAEHLPDPVVRERHVLERHPALRPARAGPARPGPRSPARCPAPRTPGAPRWWRGSWSGRSARSPRSAP